MLNEARVRELLVPFGTDLNTDQLSQILAYLDLLQRWNAKINLTAIRDPQVSVTRHFGESLYLARWTELRGSLLDVGSGAGFPGLVLKITFPELALTLLEPVAKKRAFLKEVARACELATVEVRPERIEDLAAAAVTRRSARFDVVTCRAVGGLRSVVPASVRLLKPHGRAFLWLSRRQTEELRRGRIASETVSWRQPIPLPFSSSREILWGTRSPEANHST